MVDAADLKSAVLWACRFESGGGQSRGSVAMSGPRAVSDGLATETETAFDQIAPNCL